MGYQPEEVLGRIPFDLMPPEEAERVRAVFLESAESHKAFANLENLNLTKDGRVVVLETSGIPFFDSDGRLCGYRGIDRDITERKKSEEHERTRERLEGELAERKRTEEMLLAYQERLRSLASELSRTEERGRRQIAAELHDRIGQPLALIKINLGKACQSGISPDQEEALRAIREQVEETIQDARSLTFELSPPVLYELGLIPAVEWLVEQTREQGGIAIDLEDDGQPKPLSEGIRAALFRIIRELLVNVIKHAQASAASVRLERDGGIVRVTVEDDGIGFDPSEVELRSGPMAGFGLFSIRERLSHIGGDMRIEAGPGKGTRVVALAPLERE